MATKPIKRTGFQQGIYQVSSVRKEPLGIKRVTLDGRTFRYAQAGAAALGMGKVGVQAAAVANHVNLAVVTAVKGTKVMVVTLGATAATENQYAGGYLQVNDNTGEGLNMLIASNTAAALSTACTIHLEDAIPVTITAGTSEVSLFTSPWAGIVESTTVASGFGGVAPLAVPIGNYYWAQTGGMANILAENNVASVGGWVTYGNAVAGSVELASATIAVTIASPVIGYAVKTAQIDTEYKPVFLTMD